MISDAIEDIDLSKIKTDFISRCRDTVSISETKDDGKGNGPGTIKFSITCPCIAVRLPEQPIKWLIEQKCADALIFEFVNRGIIIQAHTGFRGGKIWNQINVMPGLDPGIHVAPTKRKLKVSM